MATVLVVEDQKDNYLLIKQAVGAEHSVKWVSSISEAEKVFDDGVDLALIDIGLPDGEGYQFCQWIRHRERNGQVPVIFVSARDTMESRTTGFTIGGDDFVGKPFNLAELKARIESKLRRRQMEKSAILVCNGIVADLKSQKAQIVENGETTELNLTPIEFKILNYFLDSVDQVLAREEIHERIWGKNVYVYGRSVDTHVSKLRRKLLDKSDMIQSVHGVGYRFGSYKQDEMREASN